MAQKVGFIQNLPTSQGYIFRILRFPIKLCNFTNFKMLLLAVLIDFVLAHVESWSIMGILHFHKDDYARVHPLFRKCFRAELKSGSTVQFICRPNFACFVLHHISDIIISS